MQRLLLICLILLQCTIFAQKPEYKSYIIELKQQDDVLYDIISTDLIIEFKSLFNPKFTHSRFSGYETAKLTVYFFTFPGSNFNSIGGEVCWQEEKYEYNYLTDNYEYKTVYEDCYNIETIYRKFDPTEISNSSIKSVNSYGEISDVEYLLIPCSADCFNE